MIVNVKSEGMNLYLDIKLVKENSFVNSFVNLATKDSDKVFNFYKEHGFKTWCIQMFKWKTRYVVYT